MPWLRSGECPPERCQGRCCTHVGIWFTEPDAEVKAFLKQQQVRGNSVKGDSLGFLLDIPQRCQYLTNEGLCSLHPDMNPIGLPDRPQFCEDWPVEPSQLINDDYCGYAFSWIE